jgi:hypothetical protein
LKVKSKTEVPVDIAAFVIERLRKFAPLDPPAA